MLEWTICTNCGKVLDNSKTTCPACNEKTDKLDMDFLKNHLSNLTFIIKTLDIQLIKDQCPQIKAQNAPLEMIVLDDLFKYFSYLSLGDGVITDNELEFINELLQTSYTCDDILNLSDDKLQDVPLSFECLHELDMFAQNFDMNRVRSCNELFESYKFLGKFFMTVDEQLDPEVLEKYTSYINNLKNSLGDYLFDDYEISYSLPKEIDQDIPEEKHSLDEYLEELNKLIGLEKVKKDVNSLINLV